MEELAADGARTTGVLMKLISHVPNLAKTINGGGSGTLNLTATAPRRTARIQQTTVIEVAEELQAAAGKRDRDATVRTQTSRRLLAWRRKKGPSRRMWSGCAR